MPMTKALFFLLVIMISLPAAVEGQVITSPEVKLLSGDIHVTFSLSLDEKQLQGIRDGMEKELVFYIDLFRVWKNWADEFVLGKTYTRTVKADPVKKEFVATNSDGSLRIKKRFKSFDSMLDWSLWIRDLKLTSTRELEPGQYYVKITVESKVRKLPPVIGYFFIFLPENEFKIIGTSGILQIEAGR